MNQAVTTFSQQALLGRSGWWRPVIVLLGILAAIFLGNFPLVLVAQSSESVRQRGLDVAKFSPELLGVSPAVFMVLVLIPFVVGLLSLMLLTRCVDRRPWRSLVYGVARRIRWTRILGATALWLTISVAAEFAVASFTDQVYSYSPDPAGLLPLIGVVLLLIPLQIAFEELAVRGYFHQWICRGGTPPWVGVGASGLLFGALHYLNPEVTNFGLPVMAAFYISVGLYLGVLSVLDDGLELPLGIHLATNIYGSVLVNFEGSALPIPSLFSVQSPDPKLMFYVFLSQGIIFWFAFAKTRQWNFADLLAHPAPPDKSVTAV